MGDWVAFHMSRRERAGVLCLVTRGGGLFGQGLVFGETLEGWEKGVPISGLHVKSGVHRSPEHRAGPCGSASPGLRARALSIVALHTWVRLVRRFRTVYSLSALVHEETKFAYALLIYALAR